MVLAVSMGLSVVSYYLVERPLRYGNWRRTARFVGVAFCICLVLSGLGAMGRLEPRREALFTGGGGYSSVPEQEDEWKVPYLGNPSVPPDLVLVGSSHGLMYLPVVADIAKEHQLSVRILAVNNYPGWFATPGDEVDERRRKVDRSRLSLLEMYRPAVVVYGEFFAAEMGVGEERGALSKSCWIHSRSQGRRGWYGCEEICR